MKKLYTILLLLTFIGAAWAQESDFASSGYAAGAAEYLKLPRHAHSAALCGAVTAWQEELAGFQYNPAILDIVGIPSGYPIIGTYSFMTLDRKHVGVDASFSLSDYIAAALSLMNYGVDQIEARDEWGNFSEYFEYRALTLAATIAGRLQWPISWGVTLRYLSESMEYEAGNGFGFDLGATWRPLDELCIGISGQNVLSWLFWSTGHNDMVLPTARLGIAGILMDTTLSVELDVAKTIKQPIDVSLGVQYKLFRILSLRAGTSTSLDIEDRDFRDFDFSFGVGMRYSMFGFDYAVPITSSKLGISHKISVVVKIPQL